MARDRESGEQNKHGTILCIEQQVVWCVTRREQQEEQAQCERVNEIEIEIDFRFVEEFAVIDPPLLTHAHTAHA